MAREYDLAWQDPRRHGRKEERKAELTSDCSLKSAVCLSVFAANS